MLPNTREMYVNYFQKVTIKKGPSGIKQIEIFLVMVADLKQKTFNLIKSQTVREKKTGDVFLYSVCKLLYIKRKTV